MYRVGQNSEANHRAFGRHCIKRIYIVLFELTQSECIKRSPFAFVLHYVAPILKSRKLRRSTCMTKFRSGKWLTS
jgi:hypothetical protein